jgi:hypothetical protein
MALGVDNNLLENIRLWWARQDSNLEPDGYEPSALTIELRAHTALLISDV